MARSVCKNWPRTAASIFNAFLTPTTTARSLADPRGSSLLFSTTRLLQYPRRKSKAKKTDNNMMRGMSALKGKGLHKYMKLTVGIKDLPAPVHPSKLAPEVGDENHGLWGFFNNERSLLTLPEDLGNHGRAWTKQELRRKSWEDLHSLWWVCLKERNQLKTEDRERKRLEAGYGDFESKVRVNVIQETMKGIKSVLRERWYNWEDARQLAEEDPEIQVTEDGQVRYTPTINQYDYDSEDVLEEADPAISAGQQSKESSPFAEEPMPSEEDLRKEREAAERKTIENPSPDGLEPIIPEGTRVGEVRRRW